MTSFAFMQFEGLQARAIRFGEIAGNRAASRRQPTPEHSRDVIPRVTLFDPHVSQLIHAAFQPQGCSYCHILFAAG